MKHRETWKYVELEHRLQDFTHEFEYKIENYVFDLVLPLHKIAVEFDGPDHRLTKQKEKDKHKAEAAEALGYKVFHVEVKRASVIPAKALDGIVP